MRRIKTSFVAAALLALAAVPASAKTICVKPSGGTTVGNPCFNLISNALQYGSPATGDLVSVAAGVYKESSDIYVGTNGLKIVGPASAILDNEVTTGNTNWGFDVAGTDVVIQGLTLRNGRSLGIHVGVGADRFNLIGTTFNGVNSSCVEINANDAVIKSSKFYGCGSDGIDLYGKNITVTSNTFRGLDSDALYGEGGTNNGYDLGTVTFSHNTVSQVGGSGVYLRGVAGVVAEPGAANSVIQSNTISNSESYGVYITNDSSNTPGTALVTGNKITNTYYSGVYLSNMDANTVTANSVKNAYDDYAIVVYGGGANNVSSNLINTTYYAGIYVTYESTSDYPDGSTIRLNKINPEPDSAGIYAYYGKDYNVSNNTITNAEYGIYTYRTDTPTMIANNITNTLYSGMSIDCSDHVGTASSCTGATINLNKITGTQDDPGIYFDGYGAGAGTIIFTSNVVKNTTYQCFDLRGDNMTITKNQGLYCGAGPGEQAFDISGNNNTLTYNIARYASGDGIYLNGSGAVLTSNTASNNSEDGIDIHGSSAVVNTNHAQLNAGSGFEVAFGLTGPTGTGNTASGNSVDYCDASSSAMTVTAPTAKVTPADCAEGNGYIGD